MEDDNVFGLDIGGDRVVGLEDRVLGGFGVVEGVG